jgi:hypothetical protein
MWYAQLLSSHKAMHNRVRKDMAQQFLKQKRPSTTDYFPDRCLPNLMSLSLYILNSVLQGCQFFFYFLTSNYVRALQREKTFSSTYILCVCVLLTPSPLTTLQSRCHACRVRTTPILLAIVRASQRSPSYVSMSARFFYSTSHALVTLYIYSIFNNYIFYSPLIVPSATKSMKTSSTSLSAAPDFKGSGSVSSLAVPPPPQASGTPLNRSPLANLRTTVGAHCCPWDPLGHLEDQEPSGVWRHHLSLPTPSLPNWKNTSSCGCAALVGRLMTILFCLGVDPWLCKSSSSLGLICLCWSRCLYSRFGAFLLFSINAIWVRVGRLKTIFYSPPTTIVINKFI